VTTKLDNGFHRPDDARRVFDDSLARLGLDRVDLFLIHWPLPMHYGGDFVSTWRTLEEFKNDRRARSIGVSNFQVPHLERLARETDTTPAVNQVELHPYFPQAEMRRVHAERGILTESWSPLGKRQAPFTEPPVAEAAQRHGVTPGQVILRWQVQLGSVPIPKSATPERQRANLDVFGFELDEREVAAITALGRPDGRLFGGDPDTHEEQ
jgi:diketogulonate reductase-like aldo/keto reductase